MAHSDIAAMMDRLSPEVQHIVRLDLIQKVGNALRLHYREQQGIEDIESFAAEQVALGDQWGSF